MPVGAIYSAGIVGWRIHTGTIERDRYYCLYLEVKRVVVSAVSWTPKSPANSQP